MKNDKPITKSDLNEFGKELEEKMDERFSSFSKDISVLIDIKIDSRIGKLEQKMFEWKSEIVDIVDGLALEIRDNREFRDVSGHQIVDNTRRIEKLEKKAFAI